MNCLPMWQNVYRMCMCNGMLLVVGVSLRHVAIVCEQVCVKPEGCSCVFFITFFVVFTRRLISMNLVFPQRLCTCWRAWGKFYHPKPSIPSMFRSKVSKELFCNNERLFRLRWESLIAYWRYMEEELSYSFAIILLTVKLLSSTMYVLSRRERIMEFNLKLTLCWKDWLGVLQLNENTCSTHFDNYIYKPHSNWKGSNVSQIWEFKWVLNFS